MHAGSSLSSPTSPPIRGAARTPSAEKENTTIIDGAGKKPDIQARIGQLKAQVEEPTSNYGREKLQECLAKLAGGVAIIRVGGATFLTPSLRRPLRRPRS